MTLGQTRFAVFVDPPSPAYYADRLFDMSNSVLNRDDSLLPYVRVREAFHELGIEVHTADFLPKEPCDVGCDYYSLGVLDNVRSLKTRKNVRLRAFVLFEPPVVQPRLYAALPELTAAFERVYVHNTVGDGYDLERVDASKLRQLYWPQPRDTVVKKYWERSERLDRIVVINGNHIPRKVPNELYSKRIEAMASLALMGVVDLYGRGWAKWWSRASMWWPYWKNRKALMSIYKGACESKYEILSQYKFSLCFENMAMKGYVTEKIFDCFYAGTVPLYLGATDIQDLIPTDAYIDCRKFSSWGALLQYVKGISEDEVLRMREKGRDFVQGGDSIKYRESMENVFELEEKA